MPLDANSYRQLRGLLIHFRRQWPEIRLRPQLSRTLLRALNPADDPQGKGRCRWCHLPIDSDNASSKNTRLSPRRWHSGCADAYIVANGQNARFLWPFYDLPKCPCGNPGEELDHRESLAVAWYSGDPRRIIRSHAVGNLQWLCVECHRLKSKRDLQILWDHRRDQACLLGRTPSLKARGIGWWMSACGIPANFIQWNGTDVTAAKHAPLGRGPVTFDPARVSCPRCLIAMEKQEAEYRILTLPEGWSLDEYYARTEINQHCRRDGKILFPWALTADATSGQLSLAFEDA